MFTTGFAMGSHIQALPASIVSLTSKELQMVSHAPGLWSGHLHRSPFVNGSLLSRNAYRQAEFGLYGVKYGCFSDGIAIAP